MSFFGAACHVHLEASTPWCDTRSWMGPGRLLQLKIVTWGNEEIASDALTLHECGGAGRHAGRHSCSLSAFYPLATCVDRRLQPVESSREFIKWWPDGYEPIYYVVSPKVGGFGTAGCPARRGWGSYRCDGRGCDLFWVGMTDDS
jgi:hypothetical protein